MNGTPGKSSWLVLAALVLSCGCAVKKEKLVVSESFARAKTLAQAEVVSLFLGMSESPKSLVMKSLSLAFTAESVKRGKREKLPSASALMIVTRSGDLRLQIQAPVIRTTIADINARAGRFEMYYPRSRTVYRGLVEGDLQGVEVAVSDDEKAPRYNLSNLRPQHVTQAFFHSPAEPGSRWSVVEEDSPDERCYLLHELRVEGGGAALLQKVWIERSTLGVRRKIMYDARGVPVCDVTYGRQSADGRGFPDLVVLKRPQEGYQVEFKINKIQVDPPLNDQMFTLTLPDGVKVESIRALQEKKP